MQSLGHNVISITLWIFTLIVLVFLLSSFKSPLVADIIYYSIPLASIFALWWMIVDLWAYIQEYYWYVWFYDHNYIVLEVKLPREQAKTPQAMELVFNGLWEPGDSNGWKQDWLNLNTLEILSFEIASIGGNIHFFFWVPDKFKPRVEAHVYAQYPTATVQEVPDYTRLVNFDIETHKIMGFDYGLLAPDPVPIKTYKQMGLDKAGLKEEEKIDPITQTLEVMSSIGPQENMWVQFVTRVHKKKYTKSLTFIERLKKAAKDKNPMQLFYNEQKDWQKIVADETTKIYNKYIDKETGEKIPGNDKMSEQDRERIKLMADNASKPGYEVGMRIIYFARKEHFDGRQPSNMGSAFKAYGAADPYNNFKPSFVAAANDKWWEPGHAESVRQLKELMFPDFAGRRFFKMHGKVGHGFAKDQYPIMVLSTEELATLYHFPGSVAQTPSFERLQTSTAEAPANLPTGL